MFLQQMSFPNLLHESLNCIKYVKEIFKILAFNAKA